MTEDLRAGHRFNAARAAALAGGGNGDDVTGLGEPERAAFRQQARNWLRLDLAAWAQKVDTGTEADRVQARKTLAPWRDDPDLAGLFDAETLESLSPSERQECRALWQDIAALLRRARNDQMSIRSVCGTWAIARQLVAGIRGLGVFCAALGALLEAGDVELF